MPLLNPIYISKKGLKELKKRVSQLEHELKSAQLALRDVEKTEGRDERLDLIERYAQIDAIETELSEKMLTLKNAKQLSQPRNALVVALGSVVDMIDATGKKVRYQIVDTVEANPADGRISSSSPLGQSLIGRSVSDLIEWGAGKRQNTFRLLSIK